MTGDPSVQKTDDSSEGFQRIREILATSAYLHPCCDRTNFIIPPLRQLYRTVIAHVTSVV
jgi:hypothetical protein